MLQVGVLKAPRQEIQFAGIPVSLATGRSCLEADAPRLALGEAWISAYA
ncbi:hypothetical protein [Mesorhizobium ventifaucium]|uniref:Uncharacterized protein n=1 Tax=Mesorhizobium ventifaucium TaxID=666020 RepID=A0ABM9DWE7_9HYPH|nr:hypothetical protein [Mesorhizobium ventifaucium]CAH2401038.1 hypothetical protein MES4922_280052 [Mesorhizobium ventifaucium]